MKKDNPIDYGNIPSQANKVGQSFNFFNFVNHTLNDKVDILNDTRLTSNAFTYIYTK